MSDIDTAAADSLKVLDPERPIREADIAGPVAGRPRNPSVWTGRVLQAECDGWRWLVLRFCIRPVNGAFVLLASMDIRAHPISFSERP